MSNESSHLFIRREFTIFNKKNVFLILARVVSKIKIHKNQIAYVFMSYDHIIIVMNY